MKVNTLHQLSRKHKVMIFFCSWLDFLAVNANNVASTLLFCSQEESSQDVGHEAPSKRSKVLFSRLTPFS